MICNKRKIGFVNHVQSFANSWLRYDHLLYCDTGDTGRGYFKRLDAFQSRAANVCHSTFPSLESRPHAVAIGFLSRLLDNEVVVKYSCFSLILLHLLLKDSHFVKSCSSLN